MSAPGRAREETLSSRAGSGEREDPETTAYTEVREDFWEDPRRWRRPAQQVDSRALTSRRDFLKTGALAGGGLVLGFTVAGRLTRLVAAETPAAGAAPVALTHFLRIGPDGALTVVAKHDEMGQGIHTSLAMVVAEELEVDFDGVTVVPAIADPAYNHSAFGIQMTGGSTSSWSSFEQMRKAGAAAREMLVAAAASSWGVEPADCTAEAGEVLHLASGRKLGYGQLAEAAALLPVPENPRLKDPAEFRIIGRPMHRVDSEPKVTGRAIFSLDTQVPGMLVALVARPPSFGGKVKSFDAGRALSMPGVKAVVEVPSGVAVVAERFWQARQARAALAIDWDPGPGGELDSAELRARYAALGEQPGAVARRDGDPEAALAGAARRLEATYDVPFLAHAPMEPLSCLVSLTEGGAEIVTGSQFLGVDRMAAAQVLGLAPEQVTLRNTYLGGAFGRRANTRSDFVVEAAEVAKAASRLRAPIKTMWTREDDVRGGFYRPMWHNALAAGLDRDGKLVAWRHRIVGQSIVKGTAFEGFIVRDGIDATSVEGAATLPYAIPNLGVELHTVELPVPVQWWRSVGHSNTGFATECFLDEVAAAAGQDPVALRRALLAGHPRHLRVLDLVAEKAGWGRPLPPGVARGIAVHESFRSFVAQVAEVSIDPGTARPRVHRVVCAIDCGPVINPDTVRAQMQGGIIFALSAALYGEITLEGGRVKQSNFHDYPLVRMHEAPAVEVHIAESRDEMGGTGEPGVPPLAPAVANALFALTGRRQRRLPIGTVEA